MSLLNRIPRPPGGWRPVGSRVATVLAGLFALAVLVAPSEPAHLTPAAFLRIPLEGLLGAAVMLTLPERVRRVAAVLAGVGVGALATAKLLDLGFATVLGRPFDPVTDWPLLGNAVEFVAEASGRTGAVLAVTGAALLARAAVCRGRVAVRRLAAAVAAHRPPSPGAVVGWPRLGCGRAGRASRWCRRPPVAAHELGAVRQLPAACSTTGSSGLCWRTTPSPGSAGGAADRVTW